MKHYSKIPADTLTAIAETSEEDEAEQGDRRKRGADNTEEESSVDDVMNDLLANVEHYTEPSRTGSSSSDSSSRSSTAGDEDDSAWYCPTVVAERGTSESNTTAKQYPNQSAGFSKRTPLSPSCLSIYVSENDDDAMNILDVTNATAIQEVEASNDEENSTFSNHQTSVLDKYRLDLDERSPHGFKVVPNHENNNPQPSNRVVFFPTSNSTGRRNPLTQRTSSTTAPSPLQLAPVTREEYQRAPRVVQMQVSYGEVCQAIEKLNNYHPKYGVPLSIHEDEAREWLGKGVLLGLCHWRRLLLRKEPSGDSTFEVLCNHR